ncbi:MAG: MerR family transcriptional regulator [Flavobacteriales bacterium]|nr:MerR family transcriptional regulator [Flavobacteriales bacterium]
MQYSIRQVENLTGIKAHTLRIWENRYQFVIPHRTETNIRYYDAQQVKRLLNISTLLQKGYKVSKISELNDEELSREVLKIASGPAEGEAFFESQIAELLKATLDLDESRFEEVFNTCHLRLGFEATMLRVVSPLMERVGALWVSGQANVAQEHFISNLIRRKILVAIDSIKIQPLPDAATYLMFLPEGEWHELGLLTCKYIVKSRGARTIYLGQSLPYPDLASITLQSHPDYLLTFLTTSIHQEEIQQFLWHMRQEFPQVPLLLCGPQARLAAESLGFGTVIPSPQALIEFLSRHLKRVGTNGSKAL